MLCGCPCVGKTRFLVRNIDSRHMSNQHCFQIKSDDELVNRLLEFATHSTVSSEVSSKASSNNNAVEAHHERLPYECC